MNVGGWLKEHGINQEVWQNCSTCGSCSNKKIKCNRAGRYELHIMYNAGVYNLFENGKVILSGRNENIKSDLDNFKI